MNSNLRSRLKRIREETNKKLPTESNKQESVFSNEWKIYSQGFRYRTVEYKISESVSQDKEINIGMFSDNLVSMNLNIKDFVFFDLETTGLSSGAGTIAFLAALGIFDENNNLVVTQYFIDDFQYEDDFVKVVSERLTQAKALVTYNGATFDMQLMKSRCIITRNELPHPKYHIDMLYPSRVLFKRVLDSCSMQSVENAALQISRIDDLSGSEAPEAWFSFIKNNETERLFRVFKHNSLDILSLFNIFIFINDLVNADKAFDKDKDVCVDLYGLARMRMRINPIAGEKAYIDAIKNGNSRATLALMKYYRKTNRLEERIKLIPLLPDDKDGLYRKSRYYAVYENDLKKASLLGEASLSMFALGTKKYERCQRWLKYLHEKLEQKILL